MTVFRTLLALALSFLCTSVAALTREECKLANGEKMVQCIEKNIYDPCDDAGGVHSYASGQCASAHGEIAERKVQAAEKEIANRLKQAGASKALEEFIASQKMWRAFIDAYCRFTNEADDTQLFDTGPTYLSLGMCELRHKEQRAEELRRYLE